MQTQKEIQRSLAVLKNDVLLLTVPVAIMLQNQPRTRQTQKHENKKRKFKGLIPTVNSTYLAKRMLLYARQLSKADSFTWYCFVTKCSLRQTPHSSGHVGEQER